MKVINGLPALIQEYRDTVNPDATHQEIAEKAKIDPAVFSRYVNARVGGFKFDIEYRLCIFFSKSLGRIVNVGDIYRFDEDEMRKEMA